MSLGVEENGEKDAKGVKFLDALAHFKINFEHLFTLRKLLLSILPRFDQLFV